MNVRILSLPIAASALLTSLAHAADPHVDGEVFRELAQPDEEALTKESIKLMRDMVEKNHNGALRMRAFHAKSHGCIHGTYTPDSSRPKKTRFGTFATETGYPVWARFSNSSGAAHGDGEPDVQGIALKFIGVTGAHLWPGAGPKNNQDFIFFSSPIIPTKDAREYVESLKVLDGKESPIQFALKDLALPVLAAKGTLHGGLVVDPAAAQYWSASPYKLDKNAVKYSVRPCDGQKLTLNIKTNKDALRAALVERMNSKKGACYDFFVQFFVNENDTPIEDFRKAWDTAKSPFVKVGRVTFPKQVFDTEKQNKFCENMAFNPWRALSTHRPLGSLNRMRRALYESISNARHSANHTPTPEPTSTELE